MADYPRPDVNVRLSRAEVPAGYTKPVTIHARVVNPVEDVYYWFEFKPTSGEIKTTGVWGTPKKNAVVAAAEWYVSGVEPEETSVEVDATIYESKEREGPGEITGSDASILLVEEDIDVSLEIKEGEDCGDFITVKQGEFVCIHGTIKAKGAENLVFEPRVWLKDGPELEVEFDDDDPFSFQAVVPTDSLARGMWDVLAEVNFHRASVKRGATPKATAEESSLAEAVHAGSRRRARKPKGAK